MTEFTDDAESGYHDHILKSILERTSVLMAATFDTDFPFPVLAKLMVATEIRELGLEVRQLTVAMERVASAVERK
jgi:hypothetical protein